MKIFEIHYYFSAKYDKLKIDINFKICKNISPLIFKEKAKWEKDLNGLFLLA